MTELLKTLAAIDRDKLLIIVILIMVATGFQIVRLRHRRRGSITLGIGNGNAGRTDEVDPVAEALHIPKALATYIDGRAAHKASKAVEAPTLEIGHLKDEVGRLRTTVEETARGQSRLEGKVDLLGDGQEQIVARLDRLIESREK